MQNFENASIRRATLSDLESLADLFDGYRQFYGKATDRFNGRQFLQDRFTHNESIIFIAQEDSRALGFTQLYPSFSSVSLAKIFILNDLFVIADARRSAIATRLLEQAKRFARDAGAIKLALSTATNNFAAQHLYETNGWKKDEEFFTYEYSVS